MEVLLTECFGGEKRCQAEGRFKRGGGVSELVTLTRAPRSRGESGVVAGALRWENRDVVENRLGGSWFQPDGSDLLYHPLDFMDLQKGFNISAKSRPSSLSGCLCSREQTAKRFHSAIRFTTGCQTNVSLDFLIFKIDSIKKK